jgi:iron only hydrogenase large subunit-like protein
MKKLSKVINVVKDKCVNCHACISTCPVKFCNVASGDYVEVNEDLCIGCGNCLTSCTHGARVGIDDFPAFIADVARKVPLVAIAAPAVAANFPGTFLQLNTWLKSLGVRAVFDVSFGAELTVLSYLHYVQEKKPATVIAQPCPAIVSYIQLYKPELIPYLAPVDSPMLHTVKMIREYFTQYRDCRIVVISPCFAKKREFDETLSGETVYNITYKSISGIWQKKCQSGSAQTL